MTSTAKKPSAPKAAAKKPAAKPAKTDETAKAKRSAAPKAKSAPVAAEKKEMKAPKAAAAPNEGAEASGLRMKDLVDHVATTSGVKKAEAKAVLEAALAMMGEAVAKGEGFNLPPFGKVKVARQTDNAITLKLKQVAAKKAKSPLADAEE